MKQGDKVYQYPIVTAPREVVITNVRNLAMEPDPELPGYTYRDPLRPEDGEQFASKYVLHDDIKKLVVKMEEDAEYLLRAARELRKKYWEQYPNEIVSLLPIEIREVEMNVLWPSK